uniref:Uncharacterized protein n=1 Tax=Anguilla anguilla TaxID=7936 RepID=A0A0E9SGG6_ANGAN
MTASELLAGALSDNVCQVICTAFTGKCSHFVERPS